MKNLAFIVLFLALPAFGHVVVAQNAPLTPAQVQTEITQALTDAGVDPTIAAVTAQMLQLALAGAQVQASLSAATSKSVTDLAVKEDSDIASVNARIDAIPSGPIGPKGDTGATGANGPAGPPAFTPYAVPSNYVLPIITAHMAGGCLMQAGKCTGWTAIVNGGLYGQELKFGGTSGESGTFYDYDLEVPQGGNYNLSLNASITSGTGSFAAHFECPIGTSLGSVAYSNATSLSNNPVVLRLATPANLPAGSQRLRFVIDTAPAGNVGMVNWFYLTKQ